MKLVNTSLRYGSQQLVRSSKKKGIRGRGGRKEITVVLPDTEKTEKEAFVLFFVPSLTTHYMWKGNDLFYAALCSPEGTRRTIKTSCNNFRKQLTRKSPGLKNNKNANTENKVSRRTGVSYLLINHTSSVMGTFPPGRIALINLFYSVPS